MNKKNRQIKKALANRPESPRYQVGYGRPPHDTRFQPGQSGNPKGRPPGAKNKPIDEEDLASAFFDEAHRKININEGDRMMSVSMARAVSRSIAVNAAKGKYRQQRLFMEYYNKMQAALARAKEEALEIVLGYKAEWERELERRKRLGVSGEEPVPHPDQIHVDFDTGEIIIVGPKTRQEKAALEADVEERYRMLREPVLERIAELEAKLAEESNANLRAEILAEIEDRNRVLAMLEESHGELFRYLTTGQRPLEWDAE